jgi:Flp pilus assembly protein protease CpaA
MAFGFLFWLFLIGIVVASLQDLKRREVDNWLNVFLLVASFVFVFYVAIFNRDVTIIFRAGFALVIMFVFMNLFYYGRVFAGGDAKLLVAMTVFFVGATFYVTLINIGIFLLFLMLSGSVYGLLYSFVLYVKDFEKVNKEMKKVFDGRWWMVGACFVVMILGFVNFVFLVLGIIAVLTLGLYVFAKGLETVSMIRDVSGSELREGDWLVDDVKVKGKTIKSDWDGLSLEDIKLLKGKKKVKIKDGLPFVPAFLIAFLGYVFLKDYVLGFIASLI